MIEKKEHGALPGKDLIASLWEEKKAGALQGGTKDRIAKQHALGKYTARERINLLLDEESFEEIDQLAISPFLETKYYTDGVVTGFGKIDGRGVAIYAQDFTIRGGSLGQMHAKKICKIMDMAAKIGCPIIGILDSGGARIDEGIHALSGYGEIMQRNVRYSGVVPQLSVVLGPCAGGAVYSPSLTDFIFAVRGKSHLFITGPQVIKDVMHEAVTKEALGGTDVHSEKTGLIHSVSETEEEALASLKRVISYLPDNYRSMPSQHHYTSTNKAPDISSIIPKEMYKPYEVQKVINALVDHHSFTEIHASFAPNIVVGFARLSGYSVGIVANQSLVKAGTLDIDASCKAARFVQFCNSFNIPIISLVDIPGFLPGIEQEHNGIIRHGAKLLYAYAQATVPKITVIMRKAFGGAYIVMGSKHLGADFNFAWPGAQIAVLGANAATSILHGRMLKAIDSPAQKAQKQKDLEQEYTKEFLNPFAAAEHGYIDAIIEPNTTRAHLIRALEITHEKVEQTPSRTHGNMPL